MKKMRKANVITALALTVVMLAAMTGLAAADTLVITGTVLDSNDVGVGNAEVIAYEDPEHTIEIGKTTSNSDGAYTIMVDSGLSAGTMVYATASKPDVGSDAGSGEIDNTRGVNVSFMLFKLDIPEFATIAIPVGAILGLVLFFNHRKHKKE